MNYTGVAAGVGLNLYKVTLSVLCCVCAFFFTLGADGADAGSAATTVKTTLWVASSAAWAIPVAVTTIDTASS